MSLSMGTAICRRWSILGDVTVADDCFIQHAVCQQLVRLSVVRCVWGNFVASFVFPIHGYLFRCSVYLELYTKSTCHYKMTAMWRPGEGTGPQLPPVTIILTKRDTQCKPYPQMWVNADRYLNSNNHSFDTHGRITLRMCLRRMNTGAWCKLIS